MRLRFVSLTTLLLALLMLPAVTSGPLASSEPEVRGFWVDAFHAGIKTRAEVDALIARVQEVNANTIFAQVRRRGDSYYFDSVEPFVEDTEVEPGFDPLAYAIERAHASGIELHAWVIANAVYSGNPAVATAAWPCRVPCDPNHVFNLHGFFAPGDANWLTRTHPSFTNGTVPVTTIVPRGWRLSSGDWWLDPGHPGAAEYTVAVLRHLVERYDIDGLHLDRIRYPEMPIARVGTGPIGFATGYNGVSVRRFNAAYGRPAGSLPDPWDPSWSQWRRDQIDALVRRIYLETVAIKPHVKVSASTITFFRGPGALGGFAGTEAYSRVYQDWDGWMRQGLLDLNVPMIYKADHSIETFNQFEDWSEFAKAHQYRRQSAIGIGAFVNFFEGTLAQIHRSRLPAQTGERAVGQTLYSYATTNVETNGRPHLEFFPALVENGPYTPVPPYAFPATIPSMPWKTDPRFGHLLARIVDGSGAPADGALVRIVRVGSVARADIALFADGNGYTGAADLAPGAYRLAVTTPDGTQYLTIPEPVVPGRVTRVIVNLGAQTRGPMIRAERTLEPLGQSEEVSPLELWRLREPVADDVKQEQQAGGAQ